MSFRYPTIRRLERERARRLRARRRRAATLALALAAAAAVVGVAVASGGGPRRAAGRSPAGRAAAGDRASGRRVTGATVAGGSRRTAGSRGGPPSAQRATGRPGTDSVPILMYHVINPPPPGAPYPGLYVPASEFAAQMYALKAAGWHAVTLNELEAYWTRGVPLGPGRPIVLTFDNGYQSQYTNALPVLKRLGWVGVENIQLSGLPPSQGGLTDAQVRGLIEAGWELDTQGMSHADLVALGPSQLRYQIATARQILRSRYGVPVNWFCYPSGDYDPAVIAAVRAAGFLGSTTVVPGWASPHGDPFRLPRLRVLGGTTPAQLLAQIAGALGAPPPPAAYGH